MGQFNNLATNSRNLTVGQETKAFVTPMFSASDSIPFKTGTVKAATSVIVGGTSLELTAALDVDLYEGTLLAIKTAWTGVTSYDDWFTKYVIVSEYVEAADTILIPIEPSLVEVAAADVVRVPFWVPYYSFKTFGITGSTAFATDNVASGGLAMEKAATSNDNKISSAGPLIYGDPGLEIIKAARKQAKYYFIGTVMPEQRGGDCAVVFPSQVDKNQDSTNFYQSSVGMEVSGDVYEIPGLAANGL